MPESATPIDSSPARPKLRLIIPKTHGASTSIVEESDWSSARSTPSIDLDSDGSELILTKSESMNLEQGHNEKSLLNKTFNFDDLKSFDSSPEYETSDSSVPSTSNSEKIINLYDDLQKTSLIYNKFDDVIEKLTNLRLPANDPKAERVLSSSCRKSNRTQEKADNFENEYSNENLKNVNSSFKNITMNHINVFDENDNTLVDVKNKGSQEDLTSDVDDDDLVPRGPMNRKAHTSYFKPYDQSSDILENRVEEIYNHAENKKCLDQCLSTLIPNFQSLCEVPENESTNSDMSYNFNIQSNELDFGINNSSCHFSLPVEYKLDRISEEYHDTDIISSMSTMNDIPDWLNFPLSNSPSPVNSLIQNVMPNASLQIMPGIRVSQEPLSPSSSKVSYINTPSPSDYQSIVGSPIVEQLGTEIDQLEIYGKLDDTSKTIINNENTINMNSPDSQYLSSPSFYRTEIVDTYSKKSSINEPSNTINNTYISWDVENCTDDAKNTISNVTQHHPMYLNQQNSYFAQLSGPSEQTQSDFSEGMFQLPIENLPSIVVNSPDSNNDSINPISKNNNFLPVSANIFQEISSTDFNVIHPQESTPISSPSSTSTTLVNLSVAHTPTTSRSLSRRKILPWQSLNLPFTSASKKLKEGLDPKDVDKAMRTILRKSMKDLTSVDEDGNTQLMHLVKDPNELKKKRIRAYLIPLVERICNVRNSLSATNNDGEDALYLAAMNSPEMAYVSGYLAAAMVERHIDISQKLYHKRGDTLIHAVAAKGDTHIYVLSELLALKTNEGNYVFDLSKCNYDGKTALHLAVEAHNTSKPKVSSIRTVHLLLEHGVDPKIKEATYGNTALHQAVRLSCDPSLVQALLSYKGHEAVNSRNNSDNTSVHVAAGLSHVCVESQMKVCQYLMSYGGLTNIRNQRGKTPLALVSPDRHEKIKMIFHRRM